MAVTQPIDLNAPLDELLDYARSQFEVAFEPVAASHTTLEFLQITNMAQYVERIAKSAGKDGVELPFWAKVWPSSMMLTHLLGSLPPRPGATVLEIGAGIGICGLFAASLGFDATVTDISHDALVFARINALHNNLGDKVTVLTADFSQDRLNQRFDYILGSEVLYVEKLHRGLVKFLSAHIKAEPGAEVLLSRDWNRKAMRFFKLAEKEFQIQRKTLGCTSKDDDKEERYLCDIARMRPRKQVSAK